jgi:beta-lactamase class A
MRLSLCAFCVSQALMVAASQARATEPPQTVEQRIAAIESHHGGRLGVAALDTATGRRIEYRPAERFAMCSTFKLALVAAVLAQVDAHKTSLDDRIPYGTADLLGYAPVTKAHVQEGAMTVRALCEATIEYSDNTAANLLLTLLGGPEAVTAYVRSVGDAVTRLDRNEPTLNTNLPGDVRDTTSPAAMLGTMQTILLGRVLSATSSSLLEGWLIANTTGTHRLRAGVPAGCRVGDKTGTCANGATNDIGVIWPGTRPPILVCAYYTGATTPDADREAVLAEVGRLITAELGAGNR